MWNFMHDYLTRLMSAAQTSSMMASSFANQWSEAYLRRVRQTLELFQQTTALWSENFRMALKWAAENQMKAIEAQRELLTKGRGK